MTGQKRRTSVVRKNKRVRALVVLAGVRALGERTVAVRAPGTGNRNSIFGRRSLAENRTIKCLMRGEKHVWHDQSASSLSLKRWCLVRKLAGKMLIYCEQKKVQPIARFGIGRIRRGRELPHLHLLVGGSILDGRSRCRMERQTRTDTQRRW